MNYKLNVEEKQRLTKCPLSSTIESIESLSKEYFIINHHHQYVLLLSGAQNLDSDNLEQIEFILKTT